MTYTVWQDDRLLGETDLANERIDARYRSGNFFPTPGNEALIPTTDLSLQLRDPDGRVSPTDWVAVYDLDAIPIVDENDPEFDEPLDPALEEAVEHDAALIREWMAANESLDDGEDESFGDDFSRYQIQLMLTDGATIP